MPKKFTGIRLDEELLKLIDEAAEADGRSRNSWIGRALETAVTQHSVEPQDETPPAPPKKVTSAGGVEIQWES